MESYRKYILFGTIVLVCVAADQITKQWSEARLGRSGIDKTFAVPFEGQPGDGTLSSFVHGRLQGIDSVQIDRIVRRRTWLGCSLVEPSATLETGQQVLVTREDPRGELESRGLPDDVKISEAQSGKTAQVFIDTRYKSEEDKFRQRRKIWSGCKLSQPEHKPKEGELVMIGAPRLHSIGPVKTFSVSVPQSAEGKPLHSFLHEELGGTEEDARNIARRWTLTDGRALYKPDEPVKAGQVLTIQNRNVSVLDDFFHFSYTRNPGAAFGFLSGENSAWRRPFFLVVSFLAIAVILWIFRRVLWEQKLLIWALSLIVGGALGNFIDRMAYGWVIDFIDWHYYREYTWPTFNIADAQISIGVALMALEIFLGNNEDPEALKGKAEPSGQPAEE